MRKIFKFTNMQKRAKIHRNEKRLLFFTQAWNKENNPTENENPSPCVVQRFIELLI